MTNFAIFSPKLEVVLIIAVKILYFSLVSLILFTRFSPKRYSDDVVSLSGFKHSFHSFDICLSALLSNVIESTVYPIACLKSSDLDSVLAVSILSDIFGTAVIATVRDFWMSDNHLSAVLWKGRILLFLATASFSTGSLKTVQLLGTATP